MSRNVADDSSVRCCSVTARSRLLAYKDFRCPPESTPAELSFRPDGSVRQEPSRSKASLPRLLRAWPYRPKSPVFHGRGGRRDSESDQGQHELLSHSSGAVFSCHGDGIGTFGSSSRSPRNDRSPVVEAGAVRAPQVGSRYGVRTV